MKKEYLNIITQHLGVEPILINSSLLSAQSRQRYYWTNIPNVTQPKDKGIVLKDILETNTDNKYNLSEEKKDRVLNAKRGKGYFYNRDFMCRRSGPKGQQRNKRERAICIRKCHMYSSIVPKRILCVGGVSNKSNNETKEKEPYVYVLSLIHISEPTRPY